MSVFDFFLDLLLGAALGSLGGVFGIGGGLIAIPALGILFGLDQQMAQGTALVMVVPNVMLALWRYHQRNHINWRHALALAVSGVLFAWIGSRWAVSLDAEQMRRAFVVFLVLLALYTILRVYMKPAAVVPGLRYSWPWLAVLGCVAGLTSGVLAVGGAVVAAPVLTIAFGATQVMAQGLSLALAMPSTVVTLVTYAAHGHVDWALAIPLALGGMLSVSWGVKVAHALPERVLRGLFALFLLVCAVLLGFKA